MFTIFNGINKKMKEKFVRKVVKNGRNSYYINIPKELAKELKIRERQKLVIEKQEKEILIKDWKNNSD